MEKIIGGGEGESSEEEQRRALLREEDHQWLSRGTASELNGLRRFLDDLVESYNTAEDATGHLAEVGEWADSILLDVPDWEVEPEVAAIDDTDYATFQAPGAAGRYSLEVKIHKSFGDARIQRIHGITKLMVDRAEAHTTQRFFDRAKQKGLTWRRKRGLPFPHSLPYQSPPPSTAAGRYSEEAAVVSAAVHFVFQKTAKTILYIKSMSASAGVWGQAPVNSYNDEKFLRISLNPAALDANAQASDKARWASVVAHEILHNLGWGHPKGRYPPSLAIEIYEYCIRVVQGALDEEPDFYFIR